MNFGPEPESQNEGAAGGDALDALNETDPTFVTEDKKPQSSRNALVLGGLVVALAGVVYFMYFRKGPESAAAAPPPADDTVRTFLSSGEEHVKLMRQMLQNTDQVVQRFRAYPSQTQVPLESLRTNPFQAQAAKPAPENESLATARRRKEEERQAAVAAVANLRLQSVMQGRKYKACMINNKMYQQGQEVDGFVVEQIGANTVVVRAGSYRFELAMER